MEASRKYKGHLETIVHRYVQLANKKYELRIWSMILKTDAIFKLQKLGKTRVGIIFGNNFILVMNTEQSIEDK